ncbi:MAG: hypothetical protein V3V92_03490 [Candidatus Hydrothermarchaeales archaeon]
MSSNEEFRSLFELLADNKLSNRFCYEELLSLLEDNELQNRVKRIMRDEEQHAELMKEALRLLKESDVSAKDQT